MFSSTWWHEGHDLIDYHAESGNCKAGLRRGRFERAGAVTGVAGSGSRRLRCKGGCQDWSKWNTIVAREFVQLGGRWDWGWDWISGSLWLNTFAPFCQGSGKLRL